MASKCGQALLCLAVTWTLQRRVPLPAEVQPPRHRSIALKTEALPPPVDRGTLTLKTGEPPPPATLLPGLARGFRF